MVNMKKVAKRASIVAAGALAGFGFSKFLRQGRDVDSRLQDFLTQHRQGGSASLSDVANRVIDSFDHDLSNAERAEIHNLLKRPGVMQEFTQRFLEECADQNGWPDPELRKAAYTKLDSMDRASKDSLAVLSGFLVRTSHRRRLRVALELIINTSTEELVKKANAVSEKYPLIPGNEEEFARNYDAHLAAYGLDFNEDELDLDVVTKALFRKHDTAAARVIAEKLMAKS